MEELYRSIAVIVSENATRLVGAILITPMQLSTKFIEVCEDLGVMDDIVFELRKLVALFNAKIMKKLYSNRVIGIRVDHVKALPPALRIEAIKVNGERVILELDREDIEKILKDLGSS